MKLKWQLKLPFDKLARHGREPSRHKRPGSAQDSVRDLAALVVLEERAVPEALSEAGSAGREGRTDVMLILNFLMYEYFFEPPKQKGTYAVVNFVYEHN
jgi:hypothetical protein